MYGLRGMGNVFVDINNSDWAQCRGGAAYFNPGCYFMSPKSIAPPRAPTGDVLTVPPASGEEAQATVDALLDQQARDQQALAASEVSSSWWDRTTGAIYEGAEAVNPFSTKEGVSWLVWAAGGLAIAGLVFAGTGSPRRYGR